MLGDEIEDLVDRALLLAGVVVAAVHGGDDLCAIPEGLLEQTSRADRSFPMIRRRIGPVLGSDAREELVQVVHDSKRGHRVLLLNMGAPHGPQTPNARSAPGNPWRSSISVLRHGLLEPDGLPLVRGGIDRAAEVAPRDWQLPPRARVLVDEVLAAD